MEKRKAALLAGAALLAAHQVFALANRPYSASLGRVLTKSGKAAKDTDALIRGRLLPAGVRFVVVAAYCHLAFEDHSGILLLFERGLYGAGSALLRTVIEAAARGIWFAKCATDAQVETFAAGNKFEFPHFPDLVREVEARVSPQVDVQGVFNKLGGKKMWRVINDLSHGGNIHVSRRTRDGRIQPIYPDPELSACLSLATGAILLAGFTILEAATNNDPIEMKKLAFIGNQYMRSVAPATKNK
jgi:hypothetical protein